MTATGWELRLLGLWQLRRDSRVVSVGPRQQRVLAALAVLGPRSRHVLAGLLWPECSEDQASNSMRVSLFHISHDLPTLIADSRDPLALNSGVYVDFERANRLIGEIESPGYVAASDAVETLRRAELLPGWYDEWVLYEREQFQLRRLAALETLAAGFLSQGNLFLAMEAAYAAITIEPLRERAHLILVRAHVAADDRVAALLVYRDFKALLAEELGVEPSPRFAEALNSTVTSSARLAAQFQRAALHAATAEQQL